MSKGNRLQSAILAAAVATGLAVVGVVSGAASAAAAGTNPPDIQQRSASTVTSDVLPTVQIDSGVVWDTTMIGNTVYAAGSFSNARPAGAAAGTNLVPRTNLLAFDVTTGNLNTSFVPNINGQVKVVRKSPDGSRLYVGGSFTTVGGASHYNLAALNPTTGAVISTFKAQVGGSYVNAIAVTNDTVYVGGLISAGNGVARKNMMAFDLTGQLLGWAPTSDLQVDAMVLTPASDKLIIGGRFSLVNGVSQRGLAALSLVDGSILPWAAPATVIDGTSSGNAGIYSLSADGNAIYGTGWVYANAAAGNLEGTFSADPSTGNINWIEDCHGDTYSSYSDGTQVYTVSHAHDCSGIGGYPQASPAPGNLRHALAFTTAVQGTLTRSDNVSSTYKDWSGAPAPAMINWYPDFVTGSATGQGQAAWTLTGNGQYLVAGGEFPYVNNQLQQGLVRFARTSISGGNDAPRLRGSNSTWTLNATSQTAGNVKLSIPQNYDRDDLNLRYDLRRTGTATPIYTTSFASPFWQQRQISYTDTGLTPGQTYTYQMTATDGDGNVAFSNSVSVTVSSTVLPAYAQAVLNDGPAHYWRFNEPSGTSTGVDWGGYSNLTEQSGVTNGAAGALLNDSDTAASFSGTSTGSAVSSTLETATNVFSAEAWFKTTSTTGGKLVGFGSSLTGSSSNYDRHIYLDNSGHLIFGVYNNTTYTITSSGKYNDGAWHQVVGTLSANGMALFVDGKKIGINGGTTVGQPYSGYWRIGGDNLSGWPAAPTSKYLSGTIDDVAIYPAALTLSQVKQHFGSSGRTTNAAAAPTDSYGKAVYADSPDLYWRLDDASGKTVADASLDNSPGTYTGTVSYRVASPVTGANGTGAGFNGTNTTIGSQQSFVNPTTYSEEAWFKTTTTAGGKILGFGDKATTLSANYDRHVYMLTDGRLRFGTNGTGGIAVATSSSAYNDGGWHHVVATQGADGMHLYVDGQQVATNAATTAQTYTGFWRVGGDSAWDGVSNYFNGTIDEAAFYTSELTPSRVMAHYKASPTAINTPPTAEFTSTSTGSTASFDASPSTDDGTIASYSWDFGDGSAAGSGLTTSHSYALSGTYQVTLTVTDDHNQSASVTHPVTVNAAPTAAFTSSATNLTASLDASGSSDSDGTIASYSWDFGDGTAAGSGVTVDHTYATSGTYAVTLTVTDNGGATASVTHSVITSGSVLAADTFARTVSPGWGTADTGGAWTLPSSTGFSVANGVGRISIAKAGTGPVAYLNGVSGKDLTATIDVSFDSVPTGGGTWAYVFLRHSSSGDYQLAIKVLPTSVTIYLRKLVGSTTTVLTSKSIAMTYAANDVLTMKAQLVGSSPTTLSGKVWKSGTAEPAYQITATDSEAALQSAGAVGVQAYLSGSSTTLPVVASFDNLEVRQA